MSSTTRPIVLALSLVGLACGSGDKGTDTGASGETETETGTGTTGETTKTAAPDPTSTTGDATDPGTGTTGVPDGVEKWELRAPNFAPPKVDTWYSCMSWTFPVEQAVHIVGFEPAVDDPHVHHYVLGVYPTPVNADPADPCYTWVDNMIWGWAPGGEPLWLPEQVGFRAGDSGTVTFVMQTHYNNPLKDDFVDRGGADVYYTKQLREHDAGILRVGDILGIYIQPNDPEHEHVAVCPGWATEMYFKGDLNVVGTWLHAHEIGSRLWTDIYRGDVFHAELAREDPFVFDYQTFRPTEFVLQPGDELRTHCVYDASDRDVPTEGGEGTEDEMCINFLLYYPHDPELVSCGAL